MLTVTLLLHVVNMLLTEDIIVHPGGGADMHVCTKFHSRPLNSCHTPAEH